ncbi:PTS sugar transporter subunit IIA [Thermohalobacter berrensis]|uniref:PTS mannose transporter subunit IIAB n=1 Tax=Thermohalobacter berrensis TaxID=99594 RepID=A0A419T2L1_9FIRM|nr:fructose PTS transporter subunit IIA [Thermohalobacter berrensis]RKD31794.1 PTS mannose transporter subunit IIAB [Thermohalobacter berrensis]
MNITSLINEKLVNLELKAKDKTEAIEKLADLLKKEKKIESKKEFVKGIFKRENESTTGFGKGIAIPHCKLDSIKEASIVIGKLKKGINWNSIDGKPVYLIIMLAIPSKEAKTTHLKILSNLASSLIDDKFTNNLLKADSYEEIIKLLNENN